MTRTTLRALVGYVVAVTVLAGCGSGSDEPSSPAASGGRGGAAGAAGTSDAGTGGIIVSAGGSGGAGGTGGAMSTGGATSGTGGTSSAGTGMQPIGAICTFNQQCSQAQGTTVCCDNACALGEACPSDPLYLPCDSTADCAECGGGRLCCELTGGDQTIRFCTKQSGCDGQVLP